MWIRQLSGTFRAGAINKNWKVVCGCCSVEIIKKTAVVEEMKNLCFWGKRGSAFFWLTQIEEQRADGEVRRAGNKERKHGQRAKWPTSKNMRSKAAMWVKRRYKMTEKSEKEGFKTLNERVYIDEREGSEEKRNRPHRGRQGGDMFTLGWAGEKKKKMNEWEVCREEQGIMGSNEGREVATINQSYRHKPG